METALLTHHYFLLSSFLLLSRSENVLNFTDICQQENIIDDLRLESSSALWEEDVVFEENTNFSCFLYTSDILNCSWSFQTLQEDLQLYLYSSVCDNSRPVRPPSLLSKDRVGWKSEIMLWNKTSEMVLLFNMSLNSSWGLYSYVFNTEMLEVLSPPSNISASVKDGDLTVRWGLPHSRVSLAKSCYQYQLKVQDQVGLSDLGDKMSYTMPNADPSMSYHVSLRVKKRSKCIGSTEWSDWSHAATVGQSSSLINLAVIVSISVVIPMFLLSLLLCLRLQRVSDVLFPQIPDIPEKYKNFIERSDTYFTYPVDSIRTEEEITTVEELNAADV